MRPLQHRPCRNGTFPEINLQREIETIRHLFPYRTGMQSEDNGCHRPEWGAMATNHKSSCIGVGLRARINLPRVGFVIDAHHVE
jgi:hypothetical protein